jgi:hypothetical protein
VAAVVVGTLPTAFLAYEAVLYAATPFLPGGEGAFGAEVVLYVALVEVVAYAVLLVAHRLARASGLVAPNAVEGALPSGSLRA